MADPAVVADYLICAARDQGEPLTNLKLQKLLYYAQAWYMALYDEPLFDEDFQAWVHGPVLPSQYRRFRNAGWRPIVDEVGKPVLPAKVRAHLDEILEVFGSEPAIALERMTHREGPWLEARGDLESDANSTRRISKDTMRDFYRRMKDAEVAEG